MLYAYFANLSPLFVTWNKEDARGGVSLRGCIGNLSPMDILVGIRERISLVPEI